MNHPSSPGVFLNEARDAARAGDYAHAAERYEYFFDHALDDDPAAFYGVRLSYCLSEWARLGKHHPKARERLTQKQSAALEAFDRSGVPEKFHDYVAISKALDAMDEARATFLRYHSTGNALAQQAYQFIWRDLAAAGEYLACSDNMPDAKESYGRILLVFDATAKICQQDPDIGDADMLAHAKSSYSRDLGMIVSILRNSRRDEECSIILEQAAKDMTPRGMLELTSSAL